MQRDGEGQLIWNKGQWMDGREMNFVSRSLWQSCLQGLDEEVRSLPGYAWRVSWPIRLTPEERTQGWVVVPLAHAIFDFDMAGNGKRIDFVRPRWHRSGT